MTGLGGFIAAPPLLSARLSVAGLQPGLESFYAGSGLERPIARPTGAPRPLRMSLAFDAANYPSGSYPYRLTVTNHYRASNFGAVLDATVLVINERPSPFGASWMLRGLYSLVFNADSSVLMISPEGRPVNYLPDGQGQFQSPDHDYAVFAREAGGSYTHREKDGTRMHFSTDGKLLFSEDRNANRTSYG